MEARGWVMRIASHRRVILYCLWAGWSQWKPLDIPGTHLPYSMMQLLSSTCKPPLKKI